MKKNLIILGIFLFIGSVNAVVVYETIDYGITIPGCSGCAVKDSGDIYFTYIDDEADLIVNKRLGESSYETVMIAKNVGSVNNSVYADVYIESGRVHMCITDNSTGSTITYYRGYGTGIADATVINPGGHCQIVEGFDGYPHIFTERTEYRWDGGSWVSAVVLADDISDITINGTDYLAYIQDTSAPSYFSGGLETRTADSGAFVVRIANGNAMGARTSAAFIVNEVDDDIVYAGGSMCSAGTTDIRTGVLNSSNWGWAQSIDNAAQANCNTYFREATFSKYGETIYIYGNLLGEESIKLYSGTYLGGFSESTAVSVIGGYDFASVATNEEAYLLYQNISNIIRLRIETDSYKVSGYVYDGVTMLPISTFPLVTFTVDGVDYSGLCDVDGYYEIEKLNENTYSYVASEDNYITSTARTVALTENTSIDPIYIYPTNASTNLVNARISFSLENGTPIDNTTFKFEYIQGANCIIGTEYYYTTDVNGLIDRNILAGTYLISNINYRLRAELDVEWFHEYEVYAEVDVNMHLYVYPVGDVYNVSFFVVESENGTAIANATIYVIDSQYRHYYPDYTDVGGNASVLVPPETYYYVVSATNYATYTSSPIEINGDRAEVIALDPLAYTTFDIIITIVDENSTPVSDATLNLYGSGVYENYGIYIVTNQSNATGQSRFNGLIGFRDIYDPTSFLDFMAYANKSGYDYSIVIEFILDADYEATLALYNTSATANLVITVSESNLLSHVEIYIEDITHTCDCNLLSCPNQCPNMFLTNNSGTREIENIYQHHKYRLTFLKAGYNDQTAIILLTNQNYTHSFTMVAEENTSIFSGNIFQYGTFIGIEGVYMILNNEDNEYSALTYDFHDDYGTFVFTDVISGHYNLSLSRGGYHTKANISVDLTTNIYDAVYYIVPTDESRCTTFHVSWIYENESYEKTSLGGASIKVYALNNPEDYFLKSTDANGYATICVPVGEYVVEIEAGSEFSDITDTIFITGEPFEYTLTKWADEVVIEMEFNIGHFFSFWGHYGWLIVTLVMFLFLAAIGRMSLDIIKGKY
jgi:hypothetical protein